MTEKDILSYMRYALVLARKGLGTTSPNPMVGAVLVKNGKIIGKGFHKRKGEPHAEYMAIKEADDKAGGATLFVTLEPCVHYGATSPCVDEIMKAGIKKVYLATVDPNPIVNGRGVKRLIEEGLDVEIGICETEARLLNETYIKFITTRKPFIFMKVAITLDGKIATHKSESRWITDKKARIYVHRLRSSVDAILVGLNTVIIDDPLLTTRFVKGKNPKRIVLDSNLRIPDDAKVLGNECIVATTSSKKRELGAELWKLGTDENRRVDLRKLLKRAGDNNITSILVEGGKAVFTSFIKERLVDKFYIFIGNKIFGEKGISFLGDLGYESLEDSIELRYTNIRRIGRDLLITAYPLF